MRFLPLSNNVLIPICIFLLSLFFRTLFLDRIPVAIVDDTLNFVLNGKAIFYTGHDISGTWHPLLFTPVPYEHPQAELPYLIVAPFVGVLPFSLFNAHIFYAIANSFLSVLLYLIVKKFVGQNPAFFVGIAASLNPWSIHFGRTGYEAPLALFLYFLTFYLLLVLKGWKILLTFIPLTLGFYTYMGFKILFPILIFIWILFSWFFRKKLYTKQYFLLFMLCMGLFTYFAFSVHNQSTENRLGELSFLEPSIVSSAVDYERKLALTSPLSQLFTNKITIGAKLLIEKYLGAFSTSYLFLHNEPTRYTIWHHGFFYSIDIVLILLGICFLFIKSKRFLLLLGITLLLAPIPSVISIVETSYSLRSSLAIPILSIFVGLGFWQIIQLPQTLLMKRILFSFCVTVYLLFVSNFLYLYFFVNPIHTAEAVTLHQRVATKYLTLNALQKRNVIAVMGFPKSLFKDYLFYNNRYTRENSASIAQMVREEKYKIDSIRFLSCADIKTIDSNTTYIFDPSENCIVFDESENFIHIARINDGGVRYTIANDVICSTYTLKRYPFGITMNDLTIESMSEEKFCTTYITKLK